MFRVISVVYPLLLTCVWVRTGSGATYSWSLFISCYVSVSVTRVITHVHASVCVWGTALPLLHPRQAESKFSDIGHAYETLTNPDLKKVRTDIRECVVVFLHA